MPEDASKSPAPRETALIDAVSSDPIVGIDLGTTNSLVAYCAPSGPRVLGGADAADGCMVPSVVRYHADG